MDMTQSLDDDIRAAVDAVIASGGVLHIPQETRRIAATHPESGMSPGELAELLLKAGVSARVAIEMAPPTG